MSAPLTSTCPGGCGAGVEADRFACKPCWFRLPDWLRLAITRAWRHRGRHPRDERAAAAHRAAMDRAIKWYRDNPRGDADHRGPGGAEAPTPTTGAEP